MLIEQLLSVDVVGVGAGAEHVVVVDMSHIIIIILGLRLHHQHHIHHRHDAGHGDWNSSARPMLIEQLLSVDVVGVGAGAEHVVVVGGQGDVYAWGRGQGEFPF